MQAPTYAEAANDRAIWNEWFDPDGAVDDEEFNSMTVEERIDLLRQVWGDGDD